MSERLKRFLSLLLVLVLCVSLLPVSTFAEDEEEGEISVEAEEEGQSEEEMPQEPAVEKAVIPVIESNTGTPGYSGYCGGESDGTNLTWELVGGVLTISGTGAMADINMEEGILLPWYEYRTEISSAVISSGVTTVGIGAFVGCSNMTSVSIPATVTDIGALAFYKSGLTSVSIPAGITVINAETFCQCVALTQVYIPDTVTVIGMQAFNSCSALASIELPDSVTEIGTTAFAVCSSLASVSLGSGLVRVGQGAFNSCTAITDVRYNGTLTEWYALLASTGFEDDNDCLTGAAYLDYIDNSGGECGTVANTVFWRIWKSGLFEVYGSGAMESWAYNTSAPWYPQSDKIKAIQIGEGITTVGAYAFRYCDKALTVSFPSTLLAIGEHAFADCKGIVELNLPAGLTSIGEAAFLRCSSITSITIPGGVKTVPYMAFMKCSSATSITVSSGVEIISTYVFEGCSSVKTLSIPETVTGIGGYAFSGLYALETVSVAGSNPNYKVEGKCIIEKNTGKLVFGFNCSSIPEGVTSIGNSAFSYCSGLTALTIPEGVKSIGDYSFTNCTGLTSLTIPGSVTYIGESAFYSCTGLTDVYYTGSQAEWEALIATGTEINNDSLVNAVKHFSYLGRGKCGNNLEWAIPADTKVLEITGTGAMYDWTDSSQTPWNEYISGVTTVNVGTGVTTIGDRAFSGYSNITSVSLTDSLTSVGAYSFYGCGFTSLTLPSGLKTVKEGAFVNCSKLTAAVIPDSVETIGIWAFAYCTKLETLTLGAGLKTIDNYAFRYCTGLASLDIPDSVKTVGACAFEYCTGLKNITIGTGLENISYYAFLNCGGIQSITVAAGNAKYKAEGNCIITKETKKLVLGVDSSVIPEGVSIIDMYAFTYCSGLKNVVLPVGVTTVNVGAFSYCEGLQSITIPRSVTYIGADVFKNCTALSDVYYLGTAEEWNAVEIQTGNECLTGAKLHFCVAAGVCGGTLNWAISEDGILAFSGTGSIPSYAAGEAPWYAYRDSISKVQLDAGVDYIGINAFYDMDGINEVIFYGQEAQWQALEAISLPEGNETFFNALRKPATAEVYIANGEYAAVKAGNGIELSAIVTPGYFAQFVTWSSGNTAVATVNDEGFVSALMTPGTANIYATVTIDGRDYSAVIRVDVTPGEVSADVIGVTVTGTTVKSSLFSTDYAELGYALQLNQNAPASVVGDINRNMGRAVVKAEFEDASLSTYFRLRVADDRKLQIIPTDAAIAAFKSNPKSVAAKYTGRIAITVEDDNAPEADKYHIYHTIPVTVSVDKKLPTVKAKAVALNSFFAGASAPIVFSGGTVTGVKLDGAAPGWVTLGKNGAAVLTGAAGTAASGKLNLLVTLSGWNYEFPVSVSVKAKASAPSLSLKVTGGIDTGVAESSAVVSTKLGNAVSAFFSATVTNGSSDVTASFSIAQKNGTFTVKKGSGALAAGTYVITVFADINGDGVSDISKTAKLAVKATDPAKLVKSVAMKSTGYIDLIRSGSAVTLTLNFKNYASYVPDAGDLRFQKQDGKLWVDVAPGAVPFSIKATASGFVLTARPGAALSTADKYKVQFVDSISGLSSKQLAVSVKLGKGKVAVDRASVTLFSSDKYCAQTFNLVPDSGLNRISKVELSPKDAALLSLTPVGTSGSRWSIGFPGGTVTFTRTKTVILSVWFEGSDPAGKPNATVKLKINIV